MAEVSTTAYSMSFMRGTYDLADSTGYRLNYLLLMVMSADAGAVLACFVAAGLFIIADVNTAFAVFFMLAALVILIISKAKFPIYKR